MPTRCPECGHDATRRSMVEWWIRWLLRRAPRQECHEHVQGPTAWAEECGCTADFHAPF